MNADDLLTGAESAALAGVSAATWRNYVSKGLAPAADEPGDLGSPPNRRTPKWRRATVEHFRNNRRGQGRRTDVAAAH